MIARQLEVIGGRLDGTFITVPPGVSQIIIPVREPGYLVNSWGETVPNFGQIVLKVVGDHLEERLDSQKPIV